MPIIRGPIRKKLIAARRSQILDAAAQVFAKKGFHRTTTKEIAAAAGVAEGTIYNYFDNKQDLLVGLMAQLAELNALDDQLTESLKTDVRDFFVGAFRQRVDHIEMVGEMLQALLPEVMVEPDLRAHYYQHSVQRFSRLLEAYVQARADRGDIRPVDAPLTARAIQGMFLGLVILRILGDPVLQDGWDQIPEVMATLIFDGLSPQDEA